MDIILLFILVVLSGGFSGLTIGLNKLSKQDLKRLSELGDLQAKKVLTVVEDGNHLIVTLLLGNTLVNASLADLLGATIGQGFYAILVSTSLIFFLGELLPAVILTKYALQIGAKVTPLIKFLLIFSYFVTKPIGSLLDRFLGKEINTYYNREELHYIIKEHTDSKESDLDEQDGRLLRGVLTLSEKTVEEHMTKKEEVYSLTYYTWVDNDLLDTIRTNGYTRIPIMKSDKVVGILNSKNLIGLDKELEEKTIVSNVMRTQKFLTSECSERLDDVLSYMIEREIHISVVEKENQYIGIITMEDILEELLQKEIKDETDKI